MSGRSIDNSFGCLTRMLCRECCGPSGFPVAPVTGKVLCKGQPVSSGTITFVPIGKPGSKETGKPASGMLKSDGTFSLSTYGRFDGAIVGEHDVQFTSSEGEESEAEAPEATRLHPAANGPPKKWPTLASRRPRLHWRSKPAPKTSSRLK